MACELCVNEGGEVLWRDARLRVVLVAGAEQQDYPGYCRIVWNTHVAEMTDLGPDDRAHCMHVVFAVEHVLRELARVDKINLASLGNFTPHVHWHVIPRRHDDPNFPQAIWSERQRQPHACAADGVALRRRLDELLTAR